VNTGSFTDVALSGVQSAKNLNVGVSNTTTRQFRSSATDTAGNTSAFSTGPVFKVKAVQNGAAAVVQGGTWTNQSNSNFYGGSVRYSGAAGRSQSLTRTGTDFAIVSTKGPNRGQAAVYVDGVFKTNVDLYNATTQYRRIVYSISFPTAASHTIELRVLGTRNPSSTSNRVDFDAFLTMEP
jgi:hypothetical protein